MEINNVKDFAEYLKEHLFDERPDLAEKCTIVLNEVTKNNDNKLQGLTIQEEGTNIAPTIYADSYFKDYESGKDSIEGCIAKLIKTYEEHRPPQSLSVDFFTDFDQAKDRLAMKIINAEKNAKMLETVPNFKYGDLAAIFQVQVESNEFGNATITVKNEHMKMWGVDSQTLMNHAKANMEEKQPVHIQSMVEVLREMMGDAVTDELGMTEEAPMYVMTNETKINGAAAMIFTDKLQEFAENHDANVYILPSSIHEILLIIDNGDMDVQNLTDMVHDVNSTQVAPDEVLSDNVYFYDKDQKQLMLAETKELMVLIDNTKAVEKEEVKEKEAKVSKASKAEKVESDKPKSIKERLDEGKAKVAAKDVETKETKVKAKSQEIG